MPRWVSIDLDALTEYELSTDDEGESQVNFDRKGVSRFMDIVADVKIVGESRDIRLQAEEQFNLLLPKNMADSESGLKSVKTEPIESVASNSWAKPSQPPDVKVKIESKDQSTSTRYVVLSSDLSDVDPKTGLTPLDSHKLDRNPRGYRLIKIYQCLICKDDKGQLKTYPDQSDWRAHRHSRHPFAAPFRVFNQLKKVMPRVAQRNIQRVSQSQSHSKAERTAPTTSLTVTPSADEKQKEKKKLKKKTETHQQYEVKKQSGGKRNKSELERVNKIKIKITEQTKHKSKSKHKHDKSKDRLKEKSKDKLKKKSNTESEKDFNSNDKPKPNPIPDQSPSEGPSSSPHSSGLTQYRLLQKCKICSFVAESNVMQTINEHIRNVHQKNRNIDTYHYTVMKTLITIKPTSV